MHVHHHQRVECCPWCHDNIEKYSKMLTKNIEYQLFTSLKTGIILIEDQDDSLPYGSGTQKSKYYYQQ